MGVVCASQDPAMNDTTLMKTSNEISSSLSSDGGVDKLGVTNDDEILTETREFTGSSFDDLKSFFANDVSDGDTVYLGKIDLTSNWGSYQHNVISISKNNLIIRGGSVDDPNGFSTLNGNNAGILQLTGSGITLANINFVNAGHNGDKGSAINIQGSDCTIANCTFDNCKSTDGGAIYGDTSASNIAFENCNFTNNEAQYNFGIGGAVYILADNWQFNDCNFEKNKAATSGGAIHVASGGNLKLMDVISQKTPVQVMVTVVL